MKYPSPETPNNQVQEALSSYVKKFRGVQSTLSNIPAMRGFFGNRLFVIQAIHAGVPLKTFLSLVEVCPFSEDQWAQFMGISLKTLQRYKQEPHFIFKSQHSEKILELAEVCDFGLAVFQSKEVFAAWLKEPSIALSGYQPIELIQSSYGKALVMAELNNIEHGIFA